MTENFGIYHLKEPGDRELNLPANYWHMATCLRSIVFTDQACHEVPDMLKYYERYQGKKAYEFILKIICGLESPMLGETEILGQFKEFLKNHNRNVGSDLQEVFNRLVRDAKILRKDYLQNLGCTSYGSLLRKHTGDNLDQIVVLGAGSLAQDIFPWFAKSQCKIQILTRTPEKYQDLSAGQNNLELYSYQQPHAISQTGVLVVAAPLSSEEIQSLVSLENFSMIFDLRGNSHEDVLSSLNVTNLRVLFESIEANKKLAEKVKKDVTIAIREKAMSLGLMEKARPFGWEDLWAYA